MKNLCCLLACFWAWAVGPAAWGQIFSTQQGRVHFYSKTPLEDIEAVTQKAQAAFAPATGQVSARIPMASFEFERSLMQRHYNENYLETGKYPYGTLEAKLAEPLDTKTDGMKPATLAGKLTLHGVAKDYTIPAQIEVRGGQPVRAIAKFAVRLADHNIDVPKIVIQNIAEVIDVDVNFPLEPRKK